MQRALRLVVLLLMKFQLMTVVEEIDELEEYVARSIVLACGEYCVGECECEDVALMFAGLCASLRSIVSFNKRWVQGMP